MSRLAQGRASSPLSISGRPLSVLAWLLGAVVSFSVAVYGLKMCMDGEVREGLFIGVVFTLGGVLSAFLSWNAWYRIDFRPEHVLIRRLFYSRRIPRDDLAAVYFLQEESSSLWLTIELRGKFSNLNLPVPRRFDTESLMVELQELYPKVLVAPAAFAD